MSNGSSLSLLELEERIAIIRDNIRQLVEQAAAFSGAEDEAVIRFSWFRAGVCLEIER